MCEGRGSFFPYYSNSATISYGVLFYDFFYLQDLVTLLISTTVYEFPDCTPRPSVNQTQRGRKSQCRLSYVNVLVWSMSIPSDIPGHHSNPDLYLDC